VKQGFEVPECSRVLTINGGRRVWSRRLSASHGVLVIISICSNEYLLFLDIHIGYLHRGTEKLLEFKLFEQS